MLSWLLNLGFAGSEVPPIITEGLQFTIRGFRLHYDQHIQLQYTLNDSKIDYTIKA